MMHIPARTLAWMLLPGFLILTACSSNRTAQTESTEKTDERVTLRPDTSIMRTTQPQPKAYDQIPPIEAEQPLPVSPTVPTSGQAQPTALPPNPNARGPMPSEMPLNNPGVQGSGPGAQRGALPSESNGESRLQLARRTLQREPWMSGITASEENGHCIVLQGTVRAKEEGQHAYDMVLGAVQGCVVNQIGVKK